MARSSNLRSVMDDKRSRPHHSNPYRRVVNSFERPNHVVRASPATLQLRSTLEALQRLVAELSTEEAPDVG